MVSSFKGQNEKNLVVLKVADIVYTHQLVYQYSVYYDGVV